jgi:dihydroorotase-like cyclic amidohydrolase
MTRREGHRKSVALKTIIGVAILCAGISAQRGPNPNAPENFIKIPGPDLVLLHARVIDGTGAAPLENQTILIRDGRLAAVGSADRTPPPAGLTAIDLAGKTVMPGLVMVHEHLYYPTGTAIYGQLGESFTRLYLAGGVTTMRTGGNTNGVMDLNLKQQIDGGLRAGPSIDATAPYLNGPNNFLQMHTLTDAADARRQVAYWADMGATSYKAYMQITRAELGAAIDEAHKRGLKVTGHLCSVT